MTVLWTITVKTNIKIIFWLLFCSIWYTLEAEMNTKSGLLQAETCKFVQHMIKTPACYSTCILYDI